MTRPRGGCGCLVAKYWYAQGWYAQGWYVQGWYEGWNPEKSLQEKALTKKQPSIEGCELIYEKRQ